MIPNFKFLINVQGKLDEFRADPLYCSQLSLLLVPILTNLRPLLFNENKNSEIYWYSHILFEKMMQLTIMLNMKAYQYATAQRLIDFSLAFFKDVHELYIPVYKSELGQIIENS
jgi:hypothetical protein